MFLEDKQKDWDVHLQQLAGAIRFTKNRQTSFTPNMMMLGRKGIRSFSSRDRRWYKQRSCGSNGLESFKQFQDLESFLDITEEIQEFGVEQHGRGLETRYSSDVDLSDRHIVTYLD
ncbi:Hypothetical predicted protein, partial [Mytilus galloprovincialis]